MASVDQRCAGGAASPLDTASPSEHHSPAQQSRPQTPHSLHRNESSSLASSDTVLGNRLEVLAENDDLDPAAFLKSVRELSEKREREDNERFRKLEEDIEKGRQERIRRKEGMYGVLTGKLVNVEY